MDLRRKFVIFTLLIGGVIGEVEEIALPLGTVEIAQLAPNETVKLTVDKDPEISWTFWTFEAHSYDNENHLEFSKTEEVNFSRKASPKDVFLVENHPGLVVFKDEFVENQTKPFAYLTSHAGANMSVVLIIRGYTEKHPVPGYVNKTTTISSLQLKYDMNSIFLEFHPALVVGNTSSAQEESGSPVLTYAVYQYYLSERNFDEESFLSQLSNTMLRVDDIAANGQLVDDVFVVQNATPNGANAVMFSAYPGTAVIFSVVVTTVYADVNGSNHELSSVYATSSTFACQLNGNDALNCKVMWYTITKVICGVSVFVGLFLAFIGHRYFLFSQFLFGAYGTGLCAFIIIAVINDGILVSYTEQTGLAIAIGIIGGFLWTILWYIFGIPLLSTSLSVGLVGFMFGSIFVFLPAMNIQSMTNDTIYWLAVGAFILLFFMALLPFTKTASILSCALLGSFILIIPIDHYIGSSLKFTVVNLVRRAYVQHFNMAVLAFPFQTNDIALVCGWIGIAVVAFFVQWMREKGRAPFPPNPYQLRRWRLEEDAFNHQNAINSSEEEAQPLLVPEASEHNGGPITPTSASPREFSGYRPVVGYIANRQGGYGSIATSPSIIRSLESPTLYNTQPRGVVPPPSPRRFWGRGSATNERYTMCSSVENRDIFFPPPNHPSQK